MRVLVAGATGHLGRPLVQQLVAVGHDVAGTTRTPAKGSVLEKSGAEPIVMDALEPSQVRGAIGDWRPEAVIHALTAIPATGPLRDSDLAATNRLRREGTRHLVEACREFGVRRVVAESMVFAYGYGDHGPAELTEDMALPEMPTDCAAREHVDAVRDVERQVIGATRRDELEGIALRYGLFYGPGGGWEQIARTLRWRLLPLPGGGRGVLPWIQIHDAASATVAALEYGQPGEIYNVVDDRPARFRDLVAALADELGHPRPWPLPMWLSRRLIPYATRSLASTRLIVRNDKAKETLDWSPQYPSYVEGIQHLAYEIEQGR